MKIRDLPDLEKPRERLYKYGAKYLSNEELIAILLRTGDKGINVKELSNNVLVKLKSISDIDKMTVNELTSIKGIGKVKAIQLKAICEITKRIARPINNQKKIIKTPKDVADLLMPELRYEKREIVKVLILNSKNVVLRTINISLGGANFAYIEPKDALSEAVKMQAPKIILVHNHPSGDCKPSKGDYNVTDRMYEAATLMGIQLLDHVIIGDGTYESLLLKDTCF